MENGDFDSYVGLPEVNYIYVYTYIDNFKPRILAEVFGNLIRTSLKQPTSTWGLHQQNVGTWPNIWMISWQTDWLRVNVNC